MAFITRTLVATGLAVTALTAGVASWSLSEPSRFPAPPNVAGEDLAPALRTSRPTVVEFGASACVSCRQMKVVLAQLRQTHGDRYAVVEIDLLKQQDIARRHRIQLMPTQVFFDAQGRETGRHMGKLDLDSIVARLEHASTVRP